MPKVVSHPRCLGSGTPPFTSPLIKEVMFPPAEVMRSGADEANKTERDWTLVTKDHPAFKDTPDAQGRQGIIKILECKIEATCKAKCTFKEFSGQKIIFDVLPKNRKQAFECTLQYSGEFRVHLTISRGGKISEFIKVVNNMTTNLLNRAAVNYYGTPNEPQCPRGFMQFATYLYGKKASEVLQNELDIEVVGFVKESDRIRELGVFRDKGWCNVSNCKLIASHAAYLLLTDQDFFNGKVINAQEARYNFYFFRKGLDFVNEANKIGLPIDSAPRACKLIIRA